MKWQEINLRYVTNDPTVFCHIWSLHFVRHINPYVFFHVYDPHVSVTDNPYVSVTADPCVVCDIGSIIWSFSVTDDLPYVCCDTCYLCFSLAVKNVYAWNPRWPPVFVTDDPSVVCLFGEWVKDRSAGGQINHKTMDKNPQFVLSVSSKSPESVHPRNSFYFIQIRAVHISSIGHISWEYCTV